MRNFILNLKKEDGEEEEIALRLKSIDCEKIEKANNCILLDYVQQGSVSSIVTLLQYMRSGVGEMFTKNMAYDFYDELIDNGYTIETIMMDIVYETLVVSGVISQQDLDNIKEEREKIKNMSDEEKMEMVKARKNAQK